MVLLGDLVVDEGARLRKPRGHGVGAFLPIEVDYLRQLRVDGREVARVAEVPRRSAANARYGSHVPSLADDALRRDRQRREGVLGRQRVVAFEQLVDGALEGRTDPLTEDGDEGDERKPDHQR